MMLFNSLTFPGKEYELSSSNPVDVMRQIFLYFLLYLSRKSFTSGSTSSLRLLNDGIFTMKVLRRKYKSERKFLL